MNLGRWSDQVKIGGERRKGVHCVSQRDARDERSGETKRSIGHRAESIERGAKGRVVLVSVEAFQLLEAGVSYLVDFGPKKDNIGAKNGYFWNTNVDI